MKPLHDYTLPAIASVCLVACFPITAAQGQQCDTATVENHETINVIPCPCFVPGEEAGAIFVLPPAHYPVEILSIGIGWASLGGGQPNSTEQAIHVYAGGLPDPGSPVFSIPSPELVDGGINIFPTTLGGVPPVIDSGPITVTLEFLNDTLNNPLRPTMVYESDSPCDAGQNVVFAIPGGWDDPCTLVGLPGDWIVKIDYRTHMPADTNDDRVVDVLDLLVLLGEWGPCSAPCPPTCAADTNDDCVVDVVDLLALLGDWGPCP